MRFRSNRPPRRRPLRRLLGALLGPDRQLGDEARVMLDEANQLFDSGQYGEAAGLLGQLAEAAQAQALPRRAVQLHSRAAAAFVRSSEPDQAVRHIHAALSLLAQTGHPHRAVKLGQQAIGELRAAGFNAQAAALEKDLNARLAGQGLALASSGTPTPRPPLRRNLPTHCSQCGARLRWTDDADEVECEYCGSMARAE